MNEKNDLYLHGPDYQGFRDWLELNLEAITWQGRYRDDFEEFWKIFFMEGISLKQLMVRFDYAISESTIGPISSWFLWLKNKFLCYIFVHNQTDIRTIAEHSGVRPESLAVIFRDFFVDRFPHRDDYFNEVFQINHVTSANLSVNFAKIKNDLDIEDSFSGVSNDEMMQSMEITLYHEWHTFLKKAKQNLLHNFFDFEKMKEDLSFTKHIRFVLEILAIFLIGMILLVGVKYLNKWYEKRFSSQISIYEPQFLAVDQTLTFKDQVAPNSADFKLAATDIENIVDVTNELDTVDESDFSEESELVLVSTDALPKDFGSADLEQSEYEENRQKGGYRDMQQGGFTVFRVMMRSAGPLEAKDQIMELIKRYAIKQVDSVKPGQAVPGGLYFNLHVPIKFTREFLSQVMEVEESVLYENKSRTQNPPGMSRVFIWVKTI